jgi:hypothetical protein
VPIDTASPNTNARKTPTANMPVIKLSIVVSNV